MERTLAKRVCRYIALNLVKSSWEAHSVKGGLNHGFVVEFKSIEDRDYYVNSDPAHQDFVKSIDGKVDEARVIDFEPGVF